MAELTRSRTPSSGKVENDPSEKEFLVRIQRKNDSSLEEKANLKLKTRPLRSGNGLQIFLTRQDDPAFSYSVDITNTDYGELQREQGLRYVHTYLHKEGSRMEGTLDSVNLGANFSP